MKAIDILHYFIDQASWIEPDTVDKIIIGDPEKEVKTVLVSWMSDFRAVKHAINGKYDLLITHEPTFWAHANELDHIQKLPEGNVKLQVSLEKKRLIEDSGLVILRNHDVWDRMPKAGIPWALASFLGFDMEPAVIGAKGYQHRYDIPPIALNDLALKISEKLAPIGESQIQVFAEGNPPVSKLGIGTGCLCSIEVFHSMGCDVSIVCDDGSCYWRDIQWSVESGHPVIRVNHATSEEPGMISMVNYINEHLPNIKANPLLICFLMPSANLLLICVHMPFRLLFA